MAETVKSPFRLAIRAEGDYVNAYLAAIDTMEDAIYLGSMARMVLDMRAGP